MKKLLTTLLFSAIATASLASEKLTFINPYSPGGGNDQTIQALKPSLERKGYNVETTYLKSCNQSIDLLQQSDDPNTYLMFPNTAVSSIPGEAYCHLEMTNLENMKLLTSVFTGGLYLCSAPGKNITDYDFLNKELKVAVTTDFSMRYLKSTLSKFDNKLTLIPYRNTGTLIRAVNAGDVDLWFSSSINVLQKEDTKCFGSTFKDNLQKIKFIGEYTPEGSDYKEYKTMWLIFTKNVTDDQKELFKYALSSEEVKAFLNSRASVHTGILVDPTGKNDLTYIVENEKFFMSLPK